MKTHKVIFIDFGGVYFRSSRPILKKFSKKFNIPEEKIYKAIVGSNWTEYATGKIDDKKYWNNVSIMLNINKKRAQELRKAYYSYSKPQNGMVRLVRLLKKKYKIAALSSITAGWIEVLEKNHKISEKFHEHHYSYDHGIDKPDSKFFVSAAKKMKTKPKNCIVIDDNKTFLSNVNKIGATTILFKDAKQLETELRKLGVEI